MSALLVELPPDLRPEARVPGGCSPLGPALREPRATIYVNSWAESRQCATALPGRPRRIFLAALDYMEMGWAVLRPVALAAEDVFAQGTLWTREAEVASTFLLVDVVELFRTIAFGRQDRVPGYTPHRFTAARYHGAVSEAERVQRRFHAIALGTCNPAFPDTLRSLVRNALQEYDRWVAGLPRIMAPVYAYDLREDSGMPPLRWGMGRLRGVVRQPRQRRAGREADRRAS